MILGSNWRRWLVIAAGIAALLRLWVLREYRTAPSGDEVTYLALATSLFSGDGFALSGRPSAIFTPAYPAFLAAVMSTLGSDRGRLLLAQVLLGVATAILAAVATRQIAGQRTAAAAALLFAAYPTFVFLPRRLLSENLALPVLLATLSVSVLVLDTQERKAGLLLGLLLGLGMLTRPASVFFSATLVVGILLSARPWSEARHTLQAVGLAVLVAVSVQLPWLYRNAHVFGRPTSLTTAAGVTLYSSYWPPVNHGRRIWGNVATADDPVAREAYSSGNEAVASEAFTAITRKRLSEDPLLPLRFFPEKLLYCLIPLDWEILPRLQGSSSRVNWGYAASLALAAYGVLFRRRAGFRYGWIVAAPLAAVLLQTLVFYGSPRFRLMGEPSILIVAAFAMAPRKPEEG